MMVGVEMYKWTCTVAGRPLGGLQSEKVVGAERRRRPSRVCDWYPGGDDDGLQEWMCFDMDACPVDFELSLLGARLLQARPLAAGPGNGPCH